MTSKNRKRKAENRKSNFHFRRSYKRQLKAEVLTLSFAIRVRILFFRFGTDNSAKTFLLQPSFHHSYSALSFCYPRYTSRNFVHAQEHWRRSWERVDPYYFKNSLQFQPLNPNRHRQFFPHWQRMQNDRYRKEKKKKVVRKLNYVRKLKV